MSETILATEATIRLAIILGVLAAMALWEVAAPRRRREIPRVIRWTNNFALVVVDTIILRLSFPILAVGLAVMAAGWLGWVAGHALQAAVSRQREHLADARAVQWTRSRDGLGGVLRKILTQQNAGVETRAVGSVVQHMLLVGNESGKVAGWFDSHPPLQERVRRIYGRSMSPLVEDAVPGETPPERPPEAPLHVGLRH